MPERMNRWTGQSSHARLEGWELNGQAENGRPDPFEMPALSKSSLEELVLRYEPISRINQTDEVLFLLLSLQQKRPISEQSNGI